MSFVAGLILIDAPHSALNMLGTDSNGIDRNKTVVKKFKRGKESYPYVSAQSWRYWWKQTLHDKLNWNLSPLHKVESKNQVYTNANPLKYEDDDVFGYMRALDLTVTRTSPLKNTPLISVLPSRNSITTDSASASRHEGVPVRYDDEFYSTVLKGAFSFDLDSIGKFLFKDKAGFRNLINLDKQIDEIKTSKTKDKKKKVEKLEKLRKEIKWEEEYVNEARTIGVEMKDFEWIMPSEIRNKRAKETVNALKYLNGGAKQTLFLTDVTPKFVILAMFEGGINPFINNIVYGNNGEIIFDGNTLINRIKDFKDVLQSKKIFIGKDAGFMKEWVPEITEVNQNIDEDIEVISGSVNDIINKFVNEFDAYYGVEK